MTEEEKINRKKKEWEEITPRLQQAEKIIKAVMRKELDWIWWRDFRDEITPSEFEDLAQEILIKVHNNIDSYNPTIAKFSTWVGTITKNSVINYFRSLLVRIKRQPLKWLNEEEFISEEYSFRKENQEEIIETIFEISEQQGLLPKQEKKAFDYFYKDQLDLDQICEKMNIDSEDKVKRHLSNARRRIRNEWQQKIMNVEKNVQNIEDSIVIDDDPSIVAYVQVKHRLKKLAVKK